MITDESPVPTGPVVDSSGRLLVDRAWAVLSLDSELLSTPGRLKTLERNSPKGESLVVVRTWLVEDPDSVGNSSESVMVEFSNCRLTLRGK